MKTTTRNRMRVVQTNPLAVLVNVDESRSYTGLQNHYIARAMSLLIEFGFQDGSSHPGRLTHEQARELLVWSGQL